MTNWSHKWYFLLVLLLALAGCYSPRSNVTQVLSPSQPIVKDSFSLLPLNESGWVSFGQNDGLWLGTRGSEENETRVVTAFVRPMPANMTDDGFFTFAKSVKKVDGPGWLKVLKQEAWKDNSTGKDCVKVHTTLRDSNPRVAVKKPDPTMIIDSLYWVCKHSDGKKAVIVEYSHRFYPEGEDAGFAKKAETVFQGFEFVTGKR